MRQSGAPPRCEDCQKRLPSSKPRVQTTYGWICPDCAYARQRSNQLLRAGRK